jgi:hypothetical protein
MSARPDVTVTVNFHREGAFALSALASLEDLVKVARAAGISVETQAILDRPDELTRHIIGVRGRAIDQVQEVSLGDLGLSRNAGTSLAHGQFLAFLDGDDLWGEQWLRTAFAAATAPTAPLDVIWHPECLYVFSEPDFDGLPRPALRLLQSSDTPGFNPAMLIFANVWSANTLASRELYLRFPYRAVDSRRGIGIDDWSWNLETIAAGIHHRVVPGTVHLIRRKRESLDRQNAAAQLLPYLPASIRWGAKSVVAEPKASSAFGEQVFTSEADGDGKRCAR